MNNKFITVPVIVVAAVLLVFLLWLSLLTVQTANPQTQWVCVQEVCVADEPGGELWAQQNCGPVLDETTNQTVQACQITIDGQTQVIAQSEINLSAIRNCIEFACVQEVPVRNVNYSLS